MTFNTGNPIGSTDARDLSDNAENFDYLENSTTKLTHSDRLGTVRKTRHGMEVEHDAQIAAHETEHDAQMQSFENDFDGRLAGMAFTRVGSFATGATLTDMRQVLVWEVSQGGDGHEYGWAGTFPKVVAAGVAPATSGGIGVTAWVDRTDLTLRSDLASESGSGLVGYQPAGNGAVSTTVQSKLRESVSVKDFGAVGDGVADDTAAIQAAMDAATDGQWVDGIGKTYKITDAIACTNTVVKLRNANFVFNTDYANQGRLQLDAGSGTTAMTVELENINVDGGRGTYKIGNEPWTVFATFAGYDSIAPSLPPVFRVDSFNAETVVRVRNVNFYNVHADACAEINTYGTVFINDCEYKNISNKTFHVFHSPDDGVTQAGRTLVNNVYAKDVGILPASYLVGGVAKTRSDAYAPQGSFNFIVSHGDFTINNAIVWNYASCAVTADRNRAFNSSNTFIYHDSVYGFSNNPSSAFWLEACKQSSVSNLVIDVQNRDSRDTALDSSALQIYIKNDQRLVLNNLIIRGNTSAAKLRRAIRISGKETCQITISSFYINGLYSSDSINYGQLPSSVIGAAIRLKDGTIVSGNINAYSPKLLDIEAVNIAGNITVDNTGNPDVTGTIDDVSVSRSVFGSFTNSTTITRSLRISDNDSTGELACGSVSGQCIINGNQQIDGAISINNASARVGIHDNARITNTTIITSALDFRFTGNTTDRRVEVKDVQTFTIVGNTTKTAAAEPVIWIKPATAANILAGVISSNNILIKTGTSGSGHVLIAAGVVGVTDVNNNKLTVAWL